jgi:hypothetical protein
LAAPCSAAMGGCRFAGRLSPKTAWDEVGRRLIFRVTLAGGLGRNVTLLSLERVNVTSLPF